MKRAPAFLFIAVTSLLIGLSSIGLAAAQVAPAGNRAVTSYPAVFKVIPGTRATYGFVFTAMSCHEYGLVVGKPGGLSGMFAGSLRVARPKRRVTNASYAIVWLVVGLLWLTGPSRLKRLGRQVGSSRTTAVLTAKEWRFRRLADSREETG